MRAVLIVLAFTLTLFADDPHCPAYPTSQRQADRVQLKKERSQVRSLSAREKSQFQLSFTPSNYIDDYIFGKMAAAGIPWAAQSDDAEFLRRVL